MDKETLIRLALPASIFFLGLSILSTPLALKAYGDRINVTIDNWPLAMYR